MPKVSPLPPDVAFKQPKITAASKGDQPHEAVNKTLDPGNLCTVSLRTWAL